MSEIITMEDRQQIIKVLRSLADMLDNNAVDCEKLTTENEELKEKIEELKDQLREAESQVEDAVSSLNDINFDVR